jgi:uncharacterized protein (DUF305 family)
MRQPILVAAVLVAAAACSSKDASRTDTAAGAAATTPTTSATDTTHAAAGESSKGGGMAGMSGMANMTGDPDHDFLRMMSDHHKGLILMAHQTIETTENLGVKPTATKLDKEQDDELDKMMTMLEKDFKDPYAPKAMPEHVKMAEDLKSKHGADYDRAFLQNVITHHQEAIKMIDDYLSTAKNATVKSMAEKMKAAQTREIAEFQKKLA